MSQFESQYANPEAMVTQRTSKLAISSLVCSLILCCPLTTVVGVLLGLIAIPTIGGNPALKGKGLAIVGILLGVLFTGGQAYVASKSWPLIAQSIELVNDGPKAALTAGHGGDIAGFKAEFYGAGSSASDPEAQAFLDELRSRYGGFVSVQIGQPQQPAFGSPSMVVPYSLTFDNATVDAEAEAVFVDQNTGQMIMKIGYVKILDPDKGDLTYPPGG